MVFQIDTLRLCASARAISGVDLIPENESPGDLYI